MITDNLWYYLESTLRKVKSSSSESYIFIKEKYYYVLYCLKIDLIFHIGIDTWESISFVYNITERNSFQELHQKLHFNLDSRGALGRLSWKETKIYILNFLYKCVPFIHLYICKNLSITVFDICWTSLIIIVVYQ